MVTGHLSYCGLYYYYRYSTLHNLCWWDGSSGTNDGQNPLNCITRELINLNYRVDVWLTLEGYAENVGYPKRK